LQCSVAVKLYKVLKHSRLYVNNNYLLTNIVFGDVQVLVVRADNIMGRQTSKKTVHLPLLDEIWQMS
jgi:hypothetical protein